MRRLHHYHTHGVIVVRGVVGVDTVVVAVVVVADLILTYPLHIPKNTILLKRQRKGRKGE